MNHEYFMLHGFSSTGELLWTKRDTEISPSLKGELFSHNGQTATTSTDESNFYFANRYRVVCLSAATGETFWMVKI